MPSVLPWILVSKLQDLCAWLPKTLRHNLFLSEYFERFGYS